MVAVRVNPRETPDEVARARMLVMALWCAQQGYSVLPCKLDKSPYLPNGFKGASRDPVAIRKWFTELADPQLAISCAESGLVVVDVDDEPAFEAFLIEGGHDLPETLRVRTPSGGLHYYFRSGPGEVYPGGLCAGVDVKWNGYVLAPPSRAFSERAGSYGTYNLIGDVTDIACAPAWLCRPEERKRLAAGPAPRPTPVKTPESRDHEIELLLDRIDPDCPYETWIRVLMAVHAATSGTASGMALAVDWSAKGRKFKPEEVERKWQGFRLDGGVDIGTLCGIAKSFGADLAEIRRQACKVERLRSSALAAFDFADLDLSNVEPFDPSQDGDCDGAPASDGGLECEPIDGLTASDQSPENVEDTVHGALPAASPPDTTSDPATGGSDALYRAQVKTRAREILGRTFGSSKVKPVLTSKYLIKGWLPAEGVGVIYGESNIGKSFVVLDMLKAVATGEPWIGHRVRQGTAVYVSAEGRSEVVNRVCALGMGGCDKLKVAPLSVDLYEDNLDMHAVILALQDLNTDGDMAVVVFDTLARSFGGGDENSSADMNRVTGRVRQIAEALKITVLLVHHSGKDPSRGARGSSALKATAETEIELTRSGEGVQLRATKQRDMRSGGEVFGTLETVELGEDEDGDPVTSCRMVFDEAGRPRSSSGLSKIKAAALELLTQLIDEKGAAMSGDGALPTVTEEEFLEFADGKLPSKDAVPLRAARNALAHLIDKERVRRDGKNLWLTGDGG